MEKNGFEIFLGREDEQKKYGKEDEINRENTFTDLGSYGEEKKRSKTECDFLFENGERSKLREKIAIERTFADEDSNGGESRKG